MDFEAGQGGGAGARRARLRAPDPRRGQERRGGRRVVRRHHLREGRRRPAHDRGLPGRGPLPRRHPPLHAPPPRGERHRRRSVGRARRGVGPADPGDGQRLDPTDRLSAGEPVARARRWRANVRRARAAALLRRAGRPPRADRRRAGWSRSCCASATRSGIKEQPVLLARDGCARAAGGRGAGGLVPRQRRGARVLPDGLRAWRRGRSCSPP